MSEHPKALLQPWTSRWPCAAATAANTKLPRNTTTSKNKTKPHNNKKKKKAWIILFSCGDFARACCQIFFGPFLTVSFPLLLLPLAVAAEECRFKGNRTQTGPRSVYIPGRAVPLHDDLLTQEPPEPGPATINAPREHSAGAVGRGEGILLGKESVCVCVCVLQFRLQGCKNCSKMPSGVSICQPVPPKFKSDKGPFSAAHCCYENKETVICQKWKRAE